MVYVTIIIHRFIELIVKLVLVVSTQTKFNMLFVLLRYGAAIAAVSYN